MEYFNPVLLMILVSEVCLGLCAWHSPRFLRRVTSLPDSVALKARSRLMDVGNPEC